jgi:hypothetical protein
MGAGSIVLAPGMAALIVVPTRSVAASGAVTESTLTGGVLVARHRR